VVSLKHSGGELKTLRSLVQNTQVVSLKHSGDFPETLISQGDRPLAQKSIHNCDRHTLLMGTLKG
jgi:hypothetical protein